MSTYTDFQEDMADAKVLVNEDAEVITRYGPQPKKSFLRLQNEFEEAADAQRVVIDSLAAAQREDIYEKVTPSVKGTFEAGFTFEGLFERGKFGTEPNETYWAFTGGSAGLPHTVTAGTDPTLGGPYEQVSLNIASDISTSFGGSVELELFKSYESLRSEIVRVPSDFPDLQSAFDNYRNGRDSNVQVTVLIESGHLLTKGLSCTMGDFGRFEIKSEDPIVYLDPNFVGVPVIQNPTNGEVPRPPLCYGFHSRMPRWNVLVDMQNNHGSGLLLINCSTYCVADYGVINAGFRGWQQRAGYGFASNTNFSGATGCSARVQKAGICNLGDADLSNACKTEDLAIGALYVSRSCQVEARGADVSGSGAGGIVCRRSTVTAVDVDASNCARAAFECQQGVIDAVNSIVDNPNLEAYYSRFGGKIIASGGTVTNPNVPSRVFVCSDGGEIVTNGATKIDGVSINESHLHVDVPEFNVTYGNGIHYNPDYQAVVESGSNSNGTWIKYANGRMVAETGLKNINVTVASGAFSTQLQKPTLPVTFTTVNHISEKVVGKSAANGAGIEVFVNSCSNMSATGNEWKIQNLGVQVDGSGTGQTVESVQIRMQVTGTWK